MTYKPTVGPVGPEGAPPVHPEPSKTEFDIGFDAHDPELMMIYVPIGHYARDEKDGMAMFYGKMRESEAIGGKVIREKRMRSKQNGIIRHPAMPPGAFHKS